MNSARTGYRRLGFERFEDRLLLAIDALESSQVLRDALARSAPPQELFPPETLAPAETSAPIEGISVRFRLELTDAANVPISSLEAGDEFNLNVYVIDQRPVPKGVFAAYLDLTFDADRVERTGDVVFGDFYKNGLNVGGTLPGQLDEVGAFGGLDFPRSPEEEFLFTAPFRAIEAGSVTFQASPADLLPHSDVLLFDVEHRIGTEWIVFDTASLNVESPATTRQVGNSLGAAVGESEIDRGPGVSSLAPLPDPVLTSISSPVLQDETLLDFFEPIESRSARPEGRADFSFAPRTEPETRLPTDGARVDWRIRRFETPAADAGFIELERPAFRQLRGPRGTHASWLDMRHRTGESSIANSTSLLDTPDAIARQRVFDRRFLRISWDDFFESGVGSYANSRDGMLDIAAIAYETIRAEQADEGREPLSVQSLAENNSADEPGDDEPDAAALAIDTLFSLGVELQAARGWRLVIDLASDDDETGLANAGESTPCEQDADAGPPHPPRQGDGQPPTPRA